jgi:hypothetical protein
VTTVRDRVVLKPCRRGDRIMAALLRLLTAASGTHRRFNDVRSYVGSWGKGVNVAIGTFRRS